ncbi:glycine--tRNA ligase-like [Hylaeus volcanicus]|uniref:glycine--tRNA ligase-like n=1 Tax=Hylaeus volcanicus TaxID=313075 RepID=UPI0023B80327|nr:glycine--tRNA ligase-like [Hylaeus volcanicus]
MEGTLEEAKTCVPVNEDDSDSGSVFTKEAKIRTQCERVRKIKKEMLEASQLDKELLLLDELRRNLQRTKKKMDSSKPFYLQSRHHLENLCKRRSIFFPSFEIYGSVAGLYDYGPSGCAIKRELEAHWHRFFVIEDDLLEIDATCLTPHHVLKASGHVDRFCDIMVADTQTGECFRADKLVEDFIDNLLKTKTSMTETTIDYYKAIQRQCGGYSISQLAEVIEKEGIKSPITQNTFSTPFPFNLMFQTVYGPKQDKDQNNIVYLRPETAQGIFVNFKRFLEYNGGKLPFGVAQKGLGFRNEISPRNALLRVREFNMAEIEYFIDPLVKTHPKFDTISHLVLPLFSKYDQTTNGQLQNTLTLKEAVKNQLIGSECLAYFMAKAYLFVLECGILPTAIRLRQHLDSEKAHYASDCWDVDIETSYGWIECIGIADRSAYDLVQHATASKTPLVATRRYAEAQTVTKTSISFNHALLGQTFKKEARNVINTFEKMPSSELIKIKKQLEKEGYYELCFQDNGKVNITPEMVLFEETQKKIYEESFVPNVIEPSFGIGRLLYCILEHSFSFRSSQLDRSYLKLPLVLAPVKCSILSISQKTDFNHLVDHVSRLLKKNAISSKIDISSATIGKRYSRTDEIGIFFAVTIDFQSLKDNTVTLRHRDTMEQIRLPIDEVPIIIKDHLNQTCTWKETTQKYPIFVEQNLQEA